MNSLITLVLQDRDRCPPATGFRWSVLKGKNQRVLLQNAAYDVALDACSTAVNDSDFAKFCYCALPEIFLNDARNIFGGEGVEINEILDRKNDRFGKRRFAIRI